MGAKSSKTAKATKGDRKRQTRVVKLLEGDGVAVDDYASDGDSSQSTNSTNLDEEFEGQLEGDGFDESRKAFKSREMQGNIYDNVRKLRNKGDLDGAKALVREWLKQNPHDVHARMAYGRILWIQEEWHHAEQEFQHALGKNPKNVHVLKVYATFLASVHKDYKLASMLVSKAIDVEPKSRQLALLAAQIATRGGMVHEEVAREEASVREEAPDIKWKRHLPIKELHMPTEIKQNVKSAHLRRQLYEATFLQEKEQEQQQRDVHIEQDAGALGGLLPSSAVRGKIENIFCDLEEAIPDNPPTRPMKSRNQMWPESWYSTDTVPSEAAVAKQKKLTKEDKDILEKAQRISMWFTPHETKEWEFKQRKGSLLPVAHQGGKLKI